MARKSKKKKRNVISTTAALAKLDRMMPILKTNIVGALKIEATLEIGNDIIGNMPVRDIPGAGAYNTIKQSLSYDLALHLARTFDKGNVNRFHANDRDVASIPLMIRLLRQKRCRRALAHRMRNWNPRVDEFFAGIFEKDCLESIERASTAYTATFRGPFGKSGLKALKAVRDKHIAHSLLTDKEIDVIYNQLFKLTDCARDILDAAHVAVVGHQLDLTEREKEYREEAKTFWNRALLGKFHEEDMPD